MTRPTLTEQQLARAVRAQLARMTLADATDRLRAESWACACIGDPLCCRHPFEQARQLTDLATRSATPDAAPREPSRAQPALAHPQETTT